MDQACDSGYGSKEGENEESMDEDFESEMIYQVLLIQKIMKLQLKLWTLLMLLQISLKNVI